MITKEDIKKVISAKGKVGYEVDGLRFATMKLAVSYVNAPKGKACSEENLEGYFSLPVSETMNLIIPIKK